MAPNRALQSTIFWFVIALFFGGFLCVHYNAVVALKYFSCYGIENALSLDNLMMFYVIFNFFGFDKKNQHVALNIGLITSFILRLLFICGGWVVLKYFSMLSYGIAGFLIYSGIKMIISKEEDDTKEPSKHVIEFVQRYFKFLTPFGVVIGIIEITDIIFALDSVPASFGITYNPLIIWSSNIFAILGLRSMYFFILSKVEKISDFSKYVGVALLLIGLKLIFW